MVKEKYGGLITTTMTAINHIQPLEYEEVSRDVIEDPPPTPKPTERTTFLVLDSDGFICGLSSSKTGERNVEITLPVNHPIFSEDYMLWKLENGELKKPDGRLDELLEQEQNRPPSADDQLKAENKALSDRVDFLESVLEEMIFSIYQ